MSANILGITRELLSYGVFNHLSDEEVSVLHHLILQVQEPITVVQQKIFIRYWYKGDFYSCIASARLLQYCNQVLQMLGMPMIEETFDMELIEA